MAMMERRKERVFKTQSLGVEQNRRGWPGRSLLFFAALLLLADLPVRSQQSAPITLDVNAVNLLATVRDKKGDIVRNLTKDDFALEQDGKPQTITYFAKESDLPLTLGLLVDTSLSQRRVLDQERAASRTFLEQVLRVDKDKAFVIQFDREVTLLQDLTSSREKLQAAIDHIDTPQFSQGGSGGSSGSGGGSSGGSGGGGGGRGSHGYGGGGMGGRGGRGGGYPPRTQESRPDGKKVLKQMSEATGGRFFEASKKEPIDKIYDAIDEELRYQYSLGYTPVKADTPVGYHKLNLTVKQKDAVVQTRDGFYLDR